MCILCILHVYIHNSFIFKEIATAAAAAPPFHLKAWRPSILHMTFQEDGHVGRNYMDRFVYPKWGFRVPVQVTGKEMIFVHEIHPSPIPQRCPEVETNHGSV